MSENPRVCTDRSAVKDGKLKVSAGAYEHASGQVTLN
jgi:hypothetical protein